jgi:hypothetical protein
MGGGRKKKLVFWMNFFKAKVFLSFKPQAISCKLEKKPLVSLAA